MKITTNKISKTSLIDYLHVNSFDTKIKDFDDIDDLGIYKANILEDENYNLKNNYPLGIDYQLNGQYNNETIITFLNYPEAENFPNKAANINRKLNKEIQEYALIKRYDKLYGNLAIEYCNGAFRGKNKSSNLINIENDIINTFYPVILAENIKKNTQILIKIREIYIPFDRFDLTINGDSYSAIFRIPQYMLKTKDVRDSFNEIKILNNSNASKFYADARYTKLVDSVYMYNCLANLNIIK